MRRSASLAVLLAIAVVVAWWATRNLANAPSENEKPVDSRGTAATPAPLASRTPDASRGPGRSDASKGTKESSTGAKGTPSGESAESAPSAAFSSEVTGVVTETGGGSIAKARVVVALVAGLDIERAVGETDGTGRYTVALRTLQSMSAERRRGLALSARVDVGGHKPAQRRMDVPTIDNGPVVLDVALERGAAIRGRVLAQDGTPAGGAQVRMCDGKRGLRSTQAEDDGRFALPIPDRGSVRVLAEGSGASEGVAESSLITVVPDLDVELPDLRLVGSGVLEGRAVYPDGSPARHCMIDAAAVDGEWKGYKSLNCASAVGGAPGAQGDTGAEGRFRLAGLRPGRYLLSRAGDFRAADTRPEDVHETGDVGIKLVIDQHRLLVRVLDESGRPAIGLSYDAKASGGDAEGRSMVAATVVFPNEAAQAFEVSPGAKFVIDVEGGGLEGHGELVVPHDAWETTLNVVAKKEGPRGRLAITVTDENGKALVFHADAQTRVVKHGGPQAISSTEFSSKDGSLSPSIRPGPYDLTVTPGTEESPMTSGEAPRYFAYKQRVELRGGETTEIKVVAKIGGALRVTFRAPDGVSVKKPAMKLVPATGGEEETLRSVWISPERGRGWTNDITLGVPMTNMRPIAPGRYTLVVAVPGLRSVSVPVDITAGAVADAIVTLEKE